MKILHRISVNIDLEKKTILSKFGINLEEGFRTFSIDENDPKWNLIERHILEWQAGNYIETKFSKSELEQANYYKLDPSWHHSYPMPSHNYEYLGKTFEIINFEYKVVSNQITNFEITSEPKWGKNDFLQLNWVFDVFFVKSEVWEKYLLPMNIQCMPVLDYRTKKELKSIVQILPQGKTKISDTTVLNKNITINGNMDRYDPPSKGFFPSIEIPDKNWHFFSSKEYFGNGYSTFNSTFCSKEFYNIIKKYNLKGIDFRPVTIP
ncbi:MAG: hypothetical protein AAFO82_06645 [Bacteroidota bacterium]